MYSQCSSRYKINGKQECFPVGCVPIAAVAIVGSASVHTGIHTPRCGPADNPLLGVGLEINPSGCGPGDQPLWVWAWRLSKSGPGNPPGMGMETPLSGVGLETPLARPLNFPLGCGPGNLQGIPPSPQRSARHAGIPPPPHVDRILDTRF